MENVFENNSNETLLEEDDELIELSDEDMKKILDRMHNMNPDLF